MSKQGAEMRSGAVDFGRLYEQRMATYLAVKCALDPEVSDFWLLSNVDYFGALDDIILMVQDQTENKKLYCIQLKHTENKNKLPVTLLEQKASRKNKFGLSKYQDSFETIQENMKKKKDDLLKDISLDQVYFILWTNGPLDVKDKLQYINVESVGGMDFINTSTASNVYQVKNLPTSEAPFDETFLNQFYLFAKQVSATSLEKMIKDKLSSEFKDVHNSTIVTITDYFSKWSMGQGKTMRRITKSDIQRHLLEFLFLPHLVEPNVIDDVNFDKFDLLNETLTSFNITPINEFTLIGNVFSSIKFVLNKLCRSHLNLQLSWNTDLSPTHWDALKAIEDDVTKKVINTLRERTMFVPCATLRDVYLAAWQCRLIPLVVNCTLSENFIETILVKFGNVTKDLSFILLNPNNSVLTDHLKVFNNLNSIDGALKDRNLNESFISLQGKKKINLERFKDNTALLGEVTPDIYVRLMQGVIEVGETIEVENYYIKRDLRRPLLNLSVLSESNISKDREYMFNNDGDIFILVEYTHNSLPLKYRKNSIELADYLTEDDCKENEKLYVLLTDLGDMDQTVISAAASLHNETKKSVHVMRLNAGFLEWSFSKGTVEALQKHLVQSNLLKEENSEYNILEDDILKYSRSNINIISNNAGMGKTFMLHSIANKFEPEEWVSYVNLSEHIPKLPREGTLSFFLKYLLEYNLKNTQKYMHKFFTHIYVQCLKTGKIVCLFDGYDEVSSAHAISFLTEAKNGGLRMWITTRPTYKNVLEIGMENLSVEITHFSTEDHVTFLWKYFHSYYDVYKYDDDQIQYVIDGIGRCSSNLDKSLVVQPLQTRMFAEIFGDDINQITEKEKLTMVDLYNKFVDVKLKEYKSYEATSLKKTLSKLALKLFFTEEQLDDVLDFEDLKEEAVTFQESYKKDSIVIGLNDKGEAVFGHRTFAEFLAAFWLAKQIVNRKGQYNLPWLPILEKLYYIEMIPVRIFFDRILSQNLPLHIAVLNNDKENIRTLLKTKNFGEDLDALGRSALHIAVTYGKYYDLYVAEEVKGLKDVGSHSLLLGDNTNCQLRIREQDQYQISNEIVEELLGRGFKNTTDLLLRYDLFDYAMKSCSLNFVNTLFKRYDKATLHFEIGFSFEIFLCCIVKDNLHHILSSRKVYNFDTVREHHANELRNIFKGYNSKLLTIKYNDMYLTEIAAFFGAKETLFDLLQSGCLQLEDGNIVHKACFNGQDDILDLVHKMGADIDRFDESSWSPLYQAATRKREDIIYHLLKNHSGVMAKSSATKMTPMHYSVQGGHLECTKKLIEYGAKVNTKDAYGNTPLFYACQYGHSDIIDLFFKSGHLDISDTAVKSAINVATFHGNIDSVNKLLECGLDANNIDDNGDTPLVLASKKGFSDIVSVLANSELCNLNSMVRNETMASLQIWCAGHNHVILHTKLFLLKCDRKQLGGVTALHFAARHGHVDCAKTLVELGADKHMEDEITKYPPLVWAAMYGFERVVKILLGTVREENEDFMQTVHEAHLCLIWASMIGHEKCVEVLCEYLKESELETAVNEGNEPRIKAIISGEFGLDLWFVRENENLPLLLAAKNGYTGVIRTLLSIKYRQNHGLDEALHWAARNGHLECVKELILSGADDNSKNEKRLRLLPIVWASMYSRTKVVEYLLSNKTSDYLQNKDLHFALNYAALGGHYECVKLLLDFGLDVDNVDKDLNGTPLICACLYSGTTQVIDALLEKKCAVNVKNNDGLTALDIAAGKKNFEFVKRFVGAGALKDLIVEEQSELHKNLQLALNWAIEKEEYGLIEKLIELGIKAS